MVSVQSLRQQHQFQTGIKLGFDETPEQNDRTGVATYCQTNKRRYVGYNAVSYQKVSITFPDIKIVYDTSKKPEPPAPGLKRGHDIAPIADCKTSSALQLQSEFEHKAQNFVKFVNKNGFTASWKKTKPNQEMSFGSQQCTFEPLTKNAKNEFETLKSNKFLLLLGSCAKC